jgi:hypothetical protein
MANKGNKETGKQETVETCRMFCGCCNQVGRHTIFSCRNDKGRCRVVVECAVCGSKSRHTTVLNRKATSCAEARKKLCLQRDRSQNDLKPELPKKSRLLGWLFRLFGR